MGAIIPVLCLVSQSVLAQQAPATLDEFFERLRPQARAVMECYEERADDLALANCDAAASIVEEAYRACTLPEETYKKAVGVLGGSDRYLPLADRILSQAKDDIRSRMLNLVSTVRSRAGRC